MTIEEAIRLLHPNTTAEEIAEIEYRYGFNGQKTAIHKINKACEIACKSMEKQIPKKVTHEATLYKCCTCPTCKNVVDKFEKWGESTVRITCEYCHFCGQALDWSEANKCKNCDLEEMRKL